MPGGRSLTRPLLFLLAGCMAVTAAPSGSLQAAPGQQPTSAGSPASGARRALIDRYCVTCHNDKLRTQGLSLQTIDVANVPAGAEVWEKVIRKVRTGTMPPLGLPRPDKASLDTFASSLEDGDRSRRSIASQSRSDRNAAPTEPHRISERRARPAGARHRRRGARASRRPELRLRQHRGRARRFRRRCSSATWARRARSAGWRSAPRPWRPAAETFRMRLRPVAVRPACDGLPFGTRGGTAIRYTFPRDGEYDIKVELLDLFAGAPISEPHELEISVDGERMKVFTLAPTRRCATPDVDAAYSTGPGDLEVRVSGEGGPARRDGDVRQEDRGIGGERARSPSTGRTAKATTCCTSRTSAR